MLATGSAERPDSQPWSMSKTLCQEVFFVDLGLEALVEEMG